MKYTECEKLVSVKDKSQSIGEFLDWLQHEKEYVVCKLDIDQDNEDTYFPVNFSIEKLLAEFFDIDLDKVERERRKILCDLRRKK